MRLPFLSFFLLITLSVSGQYQTRFEASSGKQTPTYQEGIDFYKLLAKDFPQIQITEKGLTDSGKPLHLVLYSKNEIFDIKKLKSQQKAILFINNAIHPGESDGVDASMLLLRDIAVDPKKFPELENVVFGNHPFLQHWRNIKPKQHDPDQSRRTGRIWLPRKCA